MKVTSSIRISHTFMGTHGITRQGSLFPQFLGKLVRQPRLFWHTPTSVSNSNPSHYGLFAYLGSSSNRGLYLSFSIYSSLLQRKRQLYVFLHSRRCQFLQNIFSSGILSILLKYFNSNNGILSIFYTRKP
jgi:hypothetical protein